MHGAAHGSNGFSVYAARLNRILFNECPNRCVSSLNNWTIYIYIWLDRWQSNVCQCSRLIANNSRQIISALCNADMLVQGSKGLENIHSFTYFHRTAGLAAGILETILTRLPGVHHMRPVASAILSTSPHYISAETYVFADLTDSAKWTSKSPEIFWFGGYTYLPFTCFHRNSKSPLALCLCVQRFVYALDVYSSVYEIFFV